MKKKKILIILGLALGLSFSVSHGETKQVRALEQYSASNFTAFPSDWSLYSKSDTGFVTSDVSDGELVISHTNTEGSQADKYYGALYQIGTQTYEDFTFEMEFSMVSYQNRSRFIGVAFHTNIVDNYLNGLFMNYRVSSQTASSVIYSTGKFQDDTAINTTHTLEIGDYHKLKIIMSDNDIYHYIDNNFITSYSANSKYADSLLTSSFPKNGGFALLVNKSSVKIKSITISSVPEEIIEDVTQNDEDLVSTYQQETNLINFPTVVSEIKTNSDLTNLSTLEDKPSNAILNMNKDGDIVNKDGVKLDSFESIFKNTLKKEIIPIVRVEDVESANALINFLDNKINILDMAVMSSKPELVKKVKVSKSRIRGIIDFSYSELNMTQIVQTLNENYAITAVLSKDMATINNVFYVQARFKTVWVNLDDALSEFEIFNAINSSAYGLISNNYTNIYQSYSHYDDSAYVHPVFNAAHRGLPETYHENSVSGVQAAIEAGATHLEIDCYLTTDNRVVLMHDATIDRTTNGTGNIESYSLAELREFKLDLVEPLEDIPTLEDIIEAMIDSDVVLILEIKSGKMAIVDQIRTVLETYNFLDRVIFISFNLDIISRLKSTIPECPTAYLGGVNSSSFINGLVTMGQYNTIYDTNQSNANKNFNQQYLRDRGIIGWYWTFEGAAQIELTIPTYGYVGVTNNSADRYSNKVKFIRGIETSLLKNQNIADLETLNLEIETYNGTNTMVEGNIFAYEEYDTYYMVICSYRVNERTAKTYYTQAFVVYKYAETPIETSETATSTPISTEPVSISEEVPTSVETPSTSTEPVSISETSVSVEIPTSVPTSQVELSSETSEESKSANIVSIVSLSFASISIGFNIVLLILLKKKKI